MDRALHNPGPVRSSVPILLLCFACSGVIEDPTSDPPYVEDPEAPVLPGQEFLCDGDHEGGPNLVRRLTRGEYLRSIDHVLDVDLRDVAGALPDEPPSDGFSNVAAALIVTVEHVAGYEALAETAAERVDVAELGARFGEEPRAFVENLGLRLYRAPLDEAETAALLPLFEGESFEDGARLAVTAMLQAPRFLYRVEQERGDGRTVAVDPYDFASRLSYLLWGGPPDDELLARAAEDRLGDDAAIEAEVDRMLAHPRAREAARVFLADWLGLDRLDHLTRDPERFPEWTSELAAMMRAETLDTAEHLLFDAGVPLTGLFDATVAKMDPALAAYYGVPAPGADGLVDLSEVPERGGLLTQGAIATVGGNESSMVQRGLFLMDVFLCLDLDSPPEGVDTTPPPLEPGRSQRSYSEERVANPSCGGCHSQMEPLAYGLERFDATGRYVLEDEHGNPLREDGAVRFGAWMEPEPYGSVAEFGQVMARSERVRDCLTLELSEWTMGRQLRTVDGCALDALRDQVIASDGSYRDVVLAIAQSPLLRTLRTEVE